MHLSRIVLGLGILFLLVPAQSVFAQTTYTGSGGCNKSLFWPFVREPGDCLTDAERARGMTGTYRGDEVRQAPEAQQQTETVQPPPSAGENEAPRAVAAPPASSPAAEPPSSPAAAQRPTVEPASARVEPAPTAQNPAADSGRTEYQGVGGCTKGLFWPFVRETGDCLTDAEIRSGRTGTYQE